MVSNCAASNLNMEMLQRFQNGYLGIIVNAPWYVSNDTLHHDLNVPYVSDEIKRLGQRYADKMEERPNIVVKEVETTRRLKRTRITEYCAKWRLVIIPRMK